MDKQICQCGHEYSRDEYNYCPACGNIAGGYSPSTGSTCEYKTASRSTSPVQATNDSVGHSTSMAETNSVKQTESEIKKVVIKPN